MDRIYLGYDPGGADKNGAAILRVPDTESPRAEVNTCDSVDEVLDWFQRTVGKTSAHAAGIDAMMSWSTARSGWRSVDTHLRETYPLVQSSVVASNSARGSMAVQGMAMGLRLKQCYPEILLNETHPKVLYHALAQRPYTYGEQMVEWLIRTIGVRDAPAIHNDHEWDALISAWATWQGHSGRWTTDLMTGAPGLLLPAGPVTYFWP